MIWRIFYAPGVSTQGAPRRMHSKNNAPKGRKQTASESGKQPWKTNPAKFWWCSKSTKKSTFCGSSARGSTGTLCNFVANYKMTLRSCCKKKQLQSINWQRIILVINKDWAPRQGGLGGLFSYKKLYKC